MNQCRLAIVTSAIVLSACGSHVAAPAEKTTTTVSAVPEDPQSLDAKQSCAAPAADHGETTLTEARAMDNHPRIRQGGFYDEESQTLNGKRMALYRRAALEGSVEAQLRSGVLEFSALFQGEAPTAEDRDDYVRALTNVFNAALQGFERAKSVFPDMPAIIKDRKLPSEFSEPLADLPREWLDAAFAAAKLCYGGAPQR
jgi:hypothetical protein